MHKNASSSIRKALDRFCNKKLGDHISVSQLITNLYKHNITDFDSYFKFSFVRNPFDRMVSWYTYSIKSLNKTNKQKDLPSQNYLYIPSDDEINKDDFCLYVERHEDQLKNSEKFNSMKRCQYDFLCDSNGTMRMDFIGRFENIKKDFEDVCKILKLNSIRLSIRNKSNHSEYKNYYNEKSYDIVSKDFKEDLKHFGYKF